MWNWLTMRLLTDDRHGFPYGIYHVWIASSVVRHAEISRMRYICLRLALAAKHWARDNREEDSFVDYLAYIHNPSCQQIAQRHISRLLQYGLDHLIAYLCRFWKTWFEIFWNAVKAILIRSEVPKGNTFRPCLILCWAAHWIANHDIYLLGQQM